jgi:hypothetical protein
MSADGKTTQQSGICAVPLPALLGGVVQFAR